MESNQSNVSIKRNSPARGNKTMFFLLLYLIVGIFVFPAIFSAIGLDVEGMFAMPLIYVLVLFVPFLFYLLFTRQTHKAVLKWKPLGKTNALLVIGLTIALIPFVQVVIRLSALVFFPMINDFMLDIAAYPIWFSLLTIAVFPALFEEFLFRGALYAEFEQLPIKKIALITGLFFGIMHLNFHQSIYAGIFGVLYAYVLFYTQTIWAPILMHFVNNGIAVALAYVAPYNAWYAEIWENLPMFLLVYGVLSLVMLPVFVLCFKKLKASATLPPTEAEEYTEETEAPKVKVYTWAFWATLALFLLFGGIMEIGLRIL